MAMVGMIIGSGIFRVPSSVAMRLDSYWAIGGVWVAGGILSLFGALTMAELATMFPRPGGRYVYLREAFGPALAFVYGWTSLLLLRPAALGAVAIVCADYLTRTVGLWEGYENWVAVGVLALATLANYRSLVWTAMVQNVSTVTKLLAVAAVGLLALAVGDGGAFADAAAGAAAAPTPSTPTTLSAFMLALVTVMWTYSGWGSVTSMAGEVKEPGRSFPLAMWVGMVSVLLVYLIVNAGYLSVLSIDEMAASTSVARDVMEVVAGPVGAWSVGLLVVVATFGGLLASMMFSPRVYYAMARDGMLTRRFGVIHAGYQTPHLATLLAAGIGMLFVTFRSFEQLAGFFILGNMPFQVLCVLGLFWLRWRKPAAARPYRCWGYPLVPLAFLAMMGIMMVVAAYAEPWQAVWGVVALTIGIPVYYLLGLQRFDGVHAGGSSGGPQTGDR
jgi:amino acid transporter